MDELKVKLASALSLRPLGAIAMADLVKHYKQINKEKLDFKRLGFDSLQKLLETMPDIVQVKYDKKSSDYRVFLVNYEVNEAIEREIINQSQLSNSLDTSYSMKRPDKYGDWQNDTFVDSTRTSDDTRRPVSSLRNRPLTTHFRGQNDWDLYLQNFPIGTKESDLMEVFKSFGCTRIRIKKRENETLFGFATFRDYAEAEVAYVTLDMTEFKGRPLNIQFAKSSIASEDEVRIRLEKTQFTTEVNSSRQRRSSPDSGGSVDRREVAYPDHHLNFNRTNSEPDPHCHSHLHEDASSRLPWQPFAAPGYITIGNETPRHRKVSPISTPTTTSNAIQIGVAYAEAKCTITALITGDNSSGMDKLNCDRNDSSGTESINYDGKRRVQSYTTRTVQVFTDTEVDGVHDSEDNVEAVVNVINYGEEGKMGQLDSLGKLNKPEQLYSSQSNNSTSSDRIYKIVADVKIDGKKQSNSRETHETISEGTAKNNISEEQLDSDENEETTERLDSLSIAEISDQFNSSTNNELQCPTECRSNASQEITSRNEIEDKMVKTSGIFSQDSDAGIYKDVQCRKDKIRCPLININLISDLSLSKTQNGSIYTTDDLDARIEKTDPHIGVLVSIRSDSGIRMCRENLENERCAFENNGSEANCSILSRSLETASDIVPKWLRVYMRDDILLVENILKWTKIYSRNGLHLDCKYQCRPGIKSKESYLPAYPPLSYDIANSMRPETDTVSSVSLSVEAEPSTTKTPEDSSVGRCCEKTPDTMEVQFLQKMLKETELKHGFLSQEDLPDELDLIVIHVCDSNHFWGSVINSGEFMDEYEELFQMMNDIAIKARPEYRLDRARPQDKSAGIMYQKTDWCRVWIKSEVGDSEVEVFYVDFGNSEFRSIDDLWVLPKKAWHLRPMVLPFHMTGHLAKKILFEMVNTRIRVKVTRSESPTLDFVVTVKPYIEVDSEDID